VYDVDADLLREVEPDLILTQSVCGVCAVDEGRVREILADEPADPEVLGMRTSGLPSVPRHHRDPSARPWAARTGPLDSSARAADCFATVESITAEADDRPSVAVFEWLDPLHLAANWVPELVDFAGGRLPARGPGRPLGESRLGRRP